MSSLRNAVKRKAHKERAQPVERRRHGLLEKHKDYVLRAKDFHKKEQTLKDLRLKASFRNPDEFYFKMQSSQTKKGVHIQPSSTKFTEDELALMRSQDRGYILTKLQAERKKVERLQANLQGLLRAEKQESSAADLSAQRRKHVVFVDDGEEGERGDPDGSEREEDNLSAGREGEGTPGGVPPDSSKEVARGKVHRVGVKTRRRVGAAYKELEMRRARVERLGAILQEMELQKAISGKGKKRKITVEGEDGQSTTVYKWARQRQK